MAAVSAEVRMDSDAAETQARYTGRLAGVGYALAAFAVWIGWLATRYYDLVSPSEGLGYWLGITGATLMATLLLYPVRKRLRFMRHLGSTRNWFRVHMFFGVLGPILILYHSNFSLGSTNSIVALACTILVAVSGLVGRYIYAKVHTDLDGHKATMHELVNRARLSEEERARTSALLPGLLERMTMYDDIVLKPPQSFFGSLFLPIKLAVQTRWLGLRLVFFARRQLAVRAAADPRIAARPHVFRKVTSTFIREHLRRVRRVAEFSSYERLFSLWHVFHLPFFYMLVVTALLHVLAVHMY